MKRSLYSPLNSKDTSIFSSTSLHTDNEQKSNEPELPIFLNLTTENFWLLGEYPLVQDENQLLFSILCYNDSKGFSFLDFSKILKPIDIGTNRRVIETPEDLKNDNPVVISGLCDNLLDHKGNGNFPQKYFSTIIPAIHQLDERRHLFFGKMKSLGLVEHLFTLEIPPKIQKSSKKKNTRLFLILSYAGISSYYSFWYKKFSKTNNKIFHQLNFHETLEYDRKPYKLFLDFDFTGKCKGSIEHIVGEFKKDLNFSVEAICKILQSLETYFVYFYKINSKTEPLHQFSKIDILKNDCTKHLILNSIKYPTFNSKDDNENIESTWKLSFHVIWYPCKWRFSNRNSVLAFLVSSLAFDSETKSYKENFMQQNYIYKDQQVLDMSIYDNVSFRAPYGCKYEAVKDNYHPRILLPVDQSGSIEGLIRFNRNLQSKSHESFFEQNLNIYDSLNFDSSIFETGLIHHIDPNEPITNLIHIISDFIPSNSFLPKQFPHIFKLRNSVMDSNLQKLIEETFNASSDHKISQLSNTTESPINNNLPAKKNTISILPMDQNSFLEPAQDSKESSKVKQLLSLFTNYFAQEVRNVCNVLYNTLNPGNTTTFEFSFQNPVWWRVKDNDLYVFHTNGYEPMPCLASESRKFEPHKNNNTYIVLNVHTFKWYMGCHDSECVKCFRKNLDESHPLKILSNDIVPGSKQDKLKARSFIFHLIGDLDKPSAALFYCKQISGIMFRLHEHSNKLRKEQNSSQKEPQSENAHENNVSREDEEEFENNPEIQESQEAEEELGNVDDLLDSNKGLNDEINSDDVFFKSIF